MNCPECGSRLEPGSYTCANCDWKIEEKKKREISPRVLGIGAIMAVVLIVGMIFGVKSYHNTESYKMKKCIEFYKEGDYELALEQIEEIYSPQAIVVKNFFDVLYEKRSYISESSEQEYNKFEQMVLKFEEKNEVNYLPNEMKKDYERYKVAFEFTNEYIEQLSQESDGLFYNLNLVQSVMMNDVYRNASSKDGDTYTLQSLENRADITREALNELEEYDFSCIEVEDYNVLKYCSDSDESEQEYMTVYLGEYFTEVVETMMSTCSREVAKQVALINESKQKFSMTAELYMVNPDLSYAAYVGPGLEDIEGYENIYNNTEYIKKLMKKAIVYYLVSGETY